jgi:hypothetical protein
MKPKCTAAQSWSSSRQCGIEATHRNRFGGFECSEHHEMARARPVFPDSYFKKGVLVKELSSDTLTQKVQLHIAYSVFKLLGMKLWGKK